MPRTSHQVSHIVAENRARTQEVAAATGVLRVASPTSGTSIWLDVNRPRFGAAIRSQPHSYLFSRDRVSTLALSRKSGMMRPRERTRPESLRSIQRNHALNCPVAAACCRPPQCRSPVQRRSCPELESECSALTALGYSTPLYVVLVQHTRARHFTRKTCVISDQIF